MNNKLVAAAVGIVALASGGTVAADASKNPYEDKGDRYEIVAGETKAELMKERPEVIFSKWGAEASFSVKYQEEAQGDRKFLTNRVEWGKVHAYPLEPKDLMEDGGLEIEVVLDSVPSSSRFDFTIEGADELDFFYQHELSHEEKAEGRSRPENVIGSYAVYHKEKQGNEFKTGKAFHIFRPKAIDANGNEDWCELGYDAGVLSVTCSEKWLASAVYPVRIDPTFGYTTIGATQYALAIKTSGPDGEDYNARRGSPWTPSENGTVSSMSVYIDQVDTTAKPNVKAFISLANNPSTNNHTQVAVTEVLAASITGDAWNDFTMTPAITSGTSYLLNAMGSTIATANSTYYLRGDTTGGPGYYSEQPATYATPEDPWSSGAIDTGDRLSIYATYTASGGGGGGGSSGLIFFD